MRLFIVPRTALKPQRLTGPHGALGFNNTFLIDEKHQWLLRTPQLRKLGTTNHILKSVTQAATRRHDERVRLSTFWAPTGGIGDTDGTRTAIAYNAFTETL